MVAVAQREHRQHYPQPGLGRARRRRRSGATSRGSCPAALRSAGLGPEQIVALGIANQRETTVVWDRHTGRPLAPRDRLAGHPDRRDRRATSSPTARPTRSIERCGLPLATYFAGPRLRWLLDHDPGLRERRRGAATCCSARWRAG